MAHVRIAVLGAGSYVFGPSVLKDAILSQKLDGIELALMDVDGALVELLAAVGRRMAGELGVNAAVSAWTDRAGALDGADFVICSAAREIWRRFSIDCEIIARDYPQHLITEFGGVAGISYSLRQIALIQEIAADMRRLCPRATLLNVANPLPRVCQAAHEASIDTVGFCSVALSGYGRAWKLLHGEDLRYPFEPARSRLSATIAGLNHFTWLIRLRDAAGGQDLYPELRRKAAENPAALEPLTSDLFRRTGWMPTSGDSHIRDFIAPAGSVPHRTEPSHGNPEQRRQRLELLRAIAEKRAPWQPLLDRESWEKPVDFVAAVAFGRTTRFDGLNLLNRGQIPQLPDDVFVETPAEVSSMAVSPQRVDLPAEVLPMCQQTAAVTSHIVRAATTRRLRHVYEAVELDPTIIDKKAGRLAVFHCIQAHQDVLPQYTS